MKNKSLPISLEDTLLWSEELGYGWHPQEPMDYEGDYWESYVERDASPMGASLTQARLDIVRRFMGQQINEVIDIGIGGGRFVDQANCYGFDVNARAIEWLENRGALRNPYWQECRAITCWDSLEHIPDPEALINCVDEYLFVSMPIYLNQYDCLISKHFKPGEHLFYFTERGLIDYMDRLGFACLMIDDIESRLGREGIKSFAFKRVGHAVD